MDKKRIAILVIIGAIVAYFVLVRPRQAIALESPTVQTAPVPAPAPPAPDLGTQLAGIGAQVTAGLGAINTATATIPTIVPTVTAAVTQAGAAAAAIPGQVGAAATQLGTAVGTAANSIVSGVATYLPYLGPLAALGIIVGGIAQTHREYDPANKQCCDVGAVGKFNCKWGVWEIMQCIYEVYDFPMSADMKAGRFPPAPGWTREKVVNMIFAELQQWRGKIQRGSISAPVPIAHTYGSPATALRYAYTSGLSARPNLATDRAPDEFRILNAEEIAKYRVIKSEILMFNKQLIKPEILSVTRPGYTSTGVYGYLIPMSAGPGNIAIPAHWSRTRPPDIVVATRTATPTEFNINWLY